MLPPIRYKKNPPQSNPQEYGVIMVE